MSDDQTPINARPWRRREEAFEDLSLALRDRVLWPAEDYIRSFSDAGRAALAGGAVVLALGLALGGSSLSPWGGSEPAPAPQVAVTSAPTPKPAPVKAAPKPEADPTLQGATPVFKTPTGDSSKVEGSKAVASEAPVATTGNTGNPATDTFSTNPAAQPAAGATASAAASVDGP